MPRYHLRWLVGLVTACAVGIGLMRGMLAEREPFWAFYLLGLAFVCTGVAASAVVLFEPRPR